MTDPTLVEDAPPASPRRASANPPHVFGIRHHGPGCARSLVRALDALRPDCVLIEGPPESDELLRFVLAEGMVPPVALLGYCPDEPKLAVYHPFALFSPEWQTLCWAMAAGMIGAVVKDPVQDQVVWNEYLETVVKERDDWKDLYRAFRERA